MITTLASSVAELPQTEMDGLWLIGVGALVVTITAATCGRQGGLFGRRVFGAGNRKDRIGYGGTASGGTLVAIGSALVAAEHVPACWVIAATVGWIPCTLWVAAAYALRAGHRDDVRRCERPAEGDVGMAATYKFDLQIARHEMRWKQCLAKAFESDDAAQRRRTTQFGERP